jgi:hypothetical protein
MAMCVLISMVNHEDVLLSHCDCGLQTIIVNMKRGISGKPVDSHAAAYSASYSTKMRYEKKGKDRQRNIKNEIKQDFYDCLSKHGVSKTNDGLDILDHIRKSLGEKTEVTDCRSAIYNQLKSLASLQDRNKLIQLLTHNSHGEVNNDMLKVFPVLEKRSKELASRRERRVREDKIDLTFISDFMHDYCR